MKQNKILNHPSTSAEKPEKLAAYCKATADSIRLQILRLLRNESLSVLEMARILDIRQPALSHHLKILAGVGLVSTRREGNLIFYRRGLLFKQDPLKNLKSALFNTIDVMPLDADTYSKLDSVKEEREQQSLDFFNKFADKFNQNEDLVADAHQYASCLTDMLNGLHLDDRSTVLEVGPGEGKLLPLLGRSFSNIIALDRDAGMLTRARRAVSELNLDQVDFVHGDTSTAVTRGIRANLVIASMVLHHCPKPIELLKDVHQILQNDGAALIIELCRHNQEWLKETRGDLWLGFDPEELAQWAETLGFSTGQSLYLGLRNGFQIQMRLFHRKTNNPTGASRLLY